MAAFAYNAINSLGLESAGEIVAPDRSSAREQLLQRGLRPVALDQVDDETSGGRRKKVKQRSLQVFSRQFATMIDAGLNIVSALLILEQ